MACCLGLLGTLCLCTQWPSLPASCRPWAPVPVSHSSPYCTTQSGGSRITQGMSQQSNHLAAVSKIKVIETFSSTSYPLPLNATPKRRTGFRIDAQPGTQIIPRLLHARAVFSPRGERSGPRGVRADDPPPAWPHAQQEASLGPSASAPGGLRPARPRGPAAPAKGERLTRPGTHVRLWGDFQDARPRPRLSWMSKC